MGGGRKCIVLDCINSCRARRKRGISFHEVPCDGNQRKLWLKQLKPYIDPCDIKEVFHVCGEHFEEKYYLPSKRKLLHRGAIPTIFNINESSLVLGSNRCRNLTQDGGDSIHQSNELNESENVENDEEAASSPCEVEVKEEEEEEEEEYKYLFKSVKIYKENGRRDICRVCFKAALRHKKLTNRYCTKTPTYKEMMEYLKLDVNYDFYPDPVICISCTMMLVNSYNFKKKLMKTEKSLQKYYSNRASTRPTNLLIIACGRKKKTEDEITIEINDDKTTEDEDQDVQDNSMTSAKTVTECSDICEEPMTEGACDENRDEECEEIKLLTIEEPSPEVQEEEEEEVKKPNLPPGLLQHKRITMWGDPPYLCDMCGRMFQNKRQCRRHLRCHRLQNETVETFTCEVCNFTFNNINVALHMDTHRKKPYQCNFCERQFDKRNLMMTHVKAVHERAPYADCEVCGKRCLRKHLSYHMSRHFDSKDARCQVCDKVVYRSYLKQHVRTHFAYSKENRTDRSVCHICGKTIIAYLMSAHVRRHTSTPKYECKICDIKFFLEKELKSHLSRKKHMKNLMLLEVTRRGGEEGEDE